MKQNIISLVIILWVVVVIGWLAQKPPLAPSGLVSLNPDVQVSINSGIKTQNVALYQLPPLGYQEIGAVTAELAFNPKESEQKQVSVLETYVRGLAANAGASGIVVEIFALRGQVLYFSGRLVKS